jgi:hypothetical protein
VKRLIGLVHALVHVSGFSICSMYFSTYFTLSMYCTLVHVLVHASGFSAYFTTVLVHDSGL